MRGSPSTHLGHQNGLAKGRCVDGAQAADCSSHVAWLKLVLEWGNMEAPGRGSGQKQVRDLSREMMRHRK